MATVTEQEILRYNPSTKTLKMRFVVDGQEVIRKARKVPDNPTEHANLLTIFAASVKHTFEQNESTDAVRELCAGVGDWAARPEGDIKQRIAQQAMRDVVEYARAGKQYQAVGKTRPEAFKSYAQTRNLKAKIWDELTGNHVAKAAYLALEGPGAGTEYGELNSYMNSLGTAAPDWSTLVTWMDTCPDPLRINTEMSV